MLSGSFNDDGAVVGSDDVCDDSDLVFVGEIIADDHENLVCNDNHLNFIRLNFACKSNLYHPLFNAYSHTDLASLIFFFRFAKTAPMTP